MSLLHALWLVLALWLAASAAPSTAAPLVPSSPNTVAFIQTAWGGGVGGNTPGSVNGPLGVASLSSSGARAWMGCSFFDAATSNFLLVDSGHPTSVKLYNAQNSSGLVTYASSVPSTDCSGGPQALKAVAADTSGGVWVVDSGCGNVLYLASNGQWTTALSLPISPNLPASFAMRRDNAYLYVSVSTSILSLAKQLVACVNADTVGCGAFVVTLVNTTAASNLTLSFDQQTLYFLDTNAIRRVSLTLPAASYPTTATTVVSTGAAQSIVNPTAMAMSPDGSSLVVADLLSAGYSQIKQVSLTSPFTVSILGPNNVQSNCGAGANTYQNGWIGGAACFGLIQQIITGTGTLGNQMLFFEVNTGRIRAYDWAATSMRTLIGGGAPNNGFSNPANTPIGWAKGYGTESSFDVNLNAMAWDTVNNMGYAAQQVRSSSSQPPRSTYGQTLCCRSSTLPLMPYALVYAFVCAELRHCAHDRCGHRAGQRRAGQLRDGCGCLHRYGAGRQWKQRPVPSAHRLLCEQHQRAVLGRRARLRALLQQRRTEQCAVLPLHGRRRLHREDRQVRRRQRQLLPDVSLSYHRGGVRLAQCARRGGHPSDCEQQLLRHHRGWRGHMALRHRSTQRECRSAQHQLAHARAEQFCIRAVRSVSSPSDCCVRVRRALRAVLAQARATTICSTRPSA